MHSCNVVTAANAAQYMGATVLVEMIWYQDPEPLWRCFHIVGMALPMEGVYHEAGYFLTMPLDGKADFPTELCFYNIRTIRAIRHRDRHSSGNVLGRMTRTYPERSGAALPARRNSSTVPKNGSTGAAHP
ncbi:hypothetical protein [Aquipseudomonas alcaligenes]|uniref:Uncharacterized protein n=1 Tax=Aquipseudomonas alcaligenes (strain ATCC 14909 / DSM 50342 / CCUG 1425 / JCM 20561 / NBRC 14159 / NCIMB 9945 / NCTC 10367 / 1577) TaxID=1215092 RepID=U3B2J6_AQUA1|nr:hypothetical protein [Pseudomonas alcaligenes]GAD64079.1 hypothetical protein PA6_033_00050 [Pseudomonas alcaligenes NBRC 14159]SUD18886.1 Uncharacterised protein [Pseudomonas alcaligenes]